MTSLDSAPERAGVSPPADISKPGDRVAQGATVHHGLQVTAAYAWRVIIVAAAVYLLFAVLAKLTLVAVAVFVGLVITALLRPLVDLLSHKIPRGLSVAVTLLLTIVAIGAIFTFVADSRTPDIGGGPVSHVYWLATVFADPECWRYAGT
jgi:putative heme transporter